MSIVPGDDADGPPSPVNPMSDKSADRTYDERNASEQWTKTWQAAAIEYQLWEVAPTTDDEWAVALSSYCSDRHSELAPSETPPPRAVHDRGAPLVAGHYGEDGMSHLDESSAVLLSPTDTRCGDHDTSDTSHQRQHQRSSSLHTIPPSPSVDESANWHWPPPRQPDSMTVTGSNSGYPREPSALPPSQATSVQATSAGFSGPSIPKRPSHQRQFTLANTVGLPRQVVAGGEEGNNSAEAERRNMRAFYEEHGYLPSPPASRTTCLRRASAQRRLGLSGDDDSSARYTVIAKYIDLLCIMFNTKRAGITILHSDQERLYLSHTGKRHWIFPVHSALSPHAVQSPEWRCWVCPNMNKDWRFKNNPLRAAGDEQTVFFAAAPLRYHQPDGETVDFGSVLIIAPEEREFGPREQAILLRLSNMLVFQLATLQSEVMSKQSSAMYESSINFMRRSFIPDRLKANRRTAKDGEAKKRLDKKRYSQRGSGGSSHRSHSPRLMSRLSRAASPAPSTPPTTATPPTPPVRVTKTGPRDAKRTKRRDLESETLLFNDAAQTLRGILQADAVAMVDLHEFQLFVRKTSSRFSQAVGSKESIISDFLQGKPWPSNVEPVVHFVPRYSTQGVHILGSSCATDVDFDFSTPTAPEVLCQVIKDYLAKRHFWWDREDESDELSQQVMLFMPSQGQTVLLTVFMSYSGALRYASFAVWSRPPSSFDDSSRLALPFVWIIGATLMSSLAILRIWAIEESQISYSNLQAHELRTPLHQILAITQLLRTSISDFADAPVTSGEGGLTTLQQVRDLLPLLDAIDTSGTTLHGIVENILTFLDLSARDYRWVGAPSNSAVQNRIGGPQTLGVTLEELIHEAYDEDRRGRIGSGQALGHIETIFEIIPADLGELVTEDYGGALRRALGRVIHNAYRYIDFQGCVEIYVDDVKSMLPPEGCEDLANTRRIAITVIDNGRGMSPEFVREHLGEPWAKEDLYATGSGLSVHLAYRIIDLMNGEMEITSAPGFGCTVSIEVPVPVSRAHRPPISVPPGRKVAFIGFDCDPVTECFHLDRLQTSMEIQYIKLGCEIVDVDDAELVIANGDLEDTAAGLDMLSQLTAPDVVILARTSEDEHNIVATMSGPNHRVRRLLKPVTPSLILKTLSQSPVSMPATPTDEGGGLVSRSRRRPHFDPVAMVRDRSGIRPATSPWKLRGLQLEETVASLSLGDYITGRNRLARSTSHTSTGSRSASPERGVDLSSPETLLDTASEPTWTQSTPNLTTLLDKQATLKLSTPKPNAAKLQVLVVEDNVISRKILVKILRASLPNIEIVEAEDGIDAVERFRQFGQAVLVLLDINMPRMDGYATAAEMRMIEKRRALDAAGDTNDGTVTPSVRSKIIAITALSGENERHRGIVECGMDAWLTKPCSKSVLQQVVDEARLELS